jgi:hypothetical protein
MGRHASNKQGNGYKTDGNIFASHPFIPLIVSDYQVMGEGSKKGQIGLISGLPAGDLEDKREPEVSRTEAEVVLLFPRKTSA